MWWCGGDAQVCRDVYTCRENASIYAILFLTGSGWASIYKWVSTLLPSLNSSPALSLLSSPCVPSSRCWVCWVGLPPPDLLASMGGGRSVVASSCGRVLNLILVLMHLFTCPNLLACFPDLLSLSLYLFICALLRCRCSVL